MNGVCLEISDPKYGTVLDQFGTNEMEESVPRARVSLMYYSTSILNHICLIWYQFGPNLVQRKTLNGLVYKRD